MSTLIGNVMRDDNIEQCDTGSVVFIHASVGGIELTMDKYASISPLQARLFAKKLEVAADTVERMRVKRTEAPIPMPPDAGAHAVSITCPCHAQSPCPRMIPCMGVK